jgi:hypothetical protein
MSTRAGESGVCPHCGTGVRFEAGHLLIGGSAYTSGPSFRVRVPSLEWMELYLSGCPICGKTIVEGSLIGATGGGQSAGPGVIYPTGSSRPLPPEVAAVARNVADDFAEAVAVLPKSRKASAALSRRCLQMILKTVGGAKKKDLADQIDEVLPHLPPSIAQNVDAIRQVGNFAAHPMKSTNTGEIVEVEDAEAEWLLDVLEELCDHYYVAPAKAAAQRDALNKKLKDAGKPPLKQP